MYCFTVFLVFVVAGLGALITLIWFRVTDHMRANPEAAKLVAEHVIAPLLTGKKKESVPESEPEVNPKKIKGTLV